jgi:hypothetical protein
MLGLLLGLISLLEALLAVSTVKSILNNAAYMVAISMVTFEMMFTGSGRFSGSKSEREDVFPWASRAVSIFQPVCLIVLFVFSCISIFSDETPVPIS